MAAKEPPTTDFVAMLRGLAESRRAEAAVTAEGFVAQQIQGLQLVESQLSRDMSYYRARLIESERALQQVQRCIIAMENTQEQLGLLG